LLIHQAERDGHRLPDRAVHICFSTIALLCGDLNHSMSWKMRRLTGIAGVSPDPEVTVRLSVVYSASAGLGRIAGAGENFHLKPFPAGTGGTPAIPVRKPRPMIYRVFLTSAEYIAVAMY